MVREESNNDSWYLKHDWLLTAGMVIISGLGLISIYSSCFTVQGVNIEFFQRQLVWFCLSMIVYFSITLIGYQTLVKFSSYIYSFCIVMLILVSLLGYTSMGAERWFAVGPIRIQPSEFTKFAVALMLGKWFAKHEIIGLKSLLPTLAIIGLPFLLVISQPDLGTALVYLAEFAAMVFVAGLPYKYLAWLGVCGISSAPIGWMNMHDYQKKRIIVFLDPETDPLGAGYNVIQARIAVGSGGIWGKGFLQGTQSKLRFLPEPHTDFIFSVYAEEFGFVGTLAVIIVFSFIFTRVLWVSQHVPDIRARIIAVGLVAYLVFQVFVNIAMTMGLAPVTGIPLPFFSYGGSSLLTTAIVMGTLQSILQHAKR